jgi:hypothetical protein
MMCRLGMGVRCMTSMLPCLAAGGERRCPGCANALDRWCDARSRRRERPRTRISSSASSTTSPPRCSTAYARAPSTSPSGSRSAPSSTCSCPTSTPRQGLRRRADAEGHLHHVEPVRQLPGEAAAHAGRDRRRAARARRRGRSPLSGRDPTPRAVTAAAFGCLTAAQLAWLESGTSGTFAAALDKAMAAMAPQTRP